MHAKVKAYLRSDGLYNIYGETYHKRDTLKANGAQWDSKNRHWAGNEAAVKAVHGQVMQKVRIAAFCHMPERVIVATISEVELGEVRVGCGMCDSHSMSYSHGAKILEVLGPAMAG